MRLDLPYEAILRRIGGDVRCTVIERRDNEVRVRVKGKARWVDANRVRPFDITPSNPGELVVSPNYTRPRTRAVPKDVPRRDSKYLAFVRTHRCIDCGSVAPIEAHHWGEGGGTSMKCDDRRTVPLCAPCHRHYHDQGRLRRFDARTTREVFLRNQVRLLIEWVDRHG